MAKWKWYVTALIKNEQIKADGIKPTKEEALIEAERFASIYIDTPSTRSLHIGIMPNLKKFLELGKE